MVYHHHGGTTLLCQGLHILQALQVVKIQAAQQIALFQQFFHLFGILVVAHNGLYSGHTAQEIGKLIGHHHRYIFLQGTQIVCPAQGGADGIAIGVYVGAHHNVH